MFLRTLRLSTTTLGSHLNTPDRDVALALDFLFPASPLIPDGQLSQSPSPLSLDPLLLLPADPLTSLSSSPSPPSLPLLLLRLELPDQVSVPAVLHEVPDVRVEVELAALLLGALDPLLQSVAVPTPRLLPPASLPHPLVGPVVLDVAVSQFVAPVVVLHGLQHVGVDPPDVEVRGGGGGGGRVVVLDGLQLDWLWLGGPALEGVREVDPGHGHRHPGWLGEDRVGDAGGSEDGIDGLQGPPDVPALVVDEVPLGLGHGSPHVVCRHLGLVKLPLEDEDGRCKRKLRKLSRLRFRPNV